MVEGYLKKTIGGLLGKTVGFYLNDNQFIEGTLLDVKNDHLIVKINEDIFYFQLSQVHALSKNARDFRVFPQEITYLDRNNLIDILHELKYNWITINCLSNQTFTGLLSRIGEDHIVLVNNSEQLFVQSSFITDIYKGKYESTDQDSNINNEQQGNSSAKNDDDSVQLSKEENLTAPIDNFESNQSNKRSSLKEEKIALEKGDSPPTYSNNEEPINLVDNEDVHFDIEETINLINSDSSRFDHEDTVTQIDDEAAHFDIEETINLINSDSSRFDHEDTVDQIDNDSSHFDHEDTIIQIDNDSSRFDHDDIVSQIDNDSTRFDIEETINLINSDSSRFDHEDITIQIDNDSTRFDHEDTGTHIDNEAAGLDLVAHTFVGEKEVSNKAVENDINEQNKNIEDESEEFYVQPSNPIFVHLTDPDSYGPQKKSRNGKNTKMSAQEYFNKLKSLHRTNHEEEQNPIVETSSPIEKESSQMFNFIPKKNQPINHEEDIDFTEDFTFNPLPRRKRKKRKFNLDKATSNQNTTTNVTRFFTSSHQIFPTYSQSKPKQLNEDSHTKTLEKPNNDLNINSIDSIEHNEKQYFALMKYAEKMYNKFKDARLNSKSK